MDYCFKLGGSECASGDMTIVSTWLDYCFIVSNWVARSVLVWRHVDYCFRLGGSECASVATCGLLFQTGWLGLVWRHVDYCFRLVARSVLVWRHVDYCFRLGGSELVWRNVDSCFKLGGSECASVYCFKLTCASGLLFQTGWLGVC